MAARDPELEAVEQALNALAFASSDAALERVVSGLLPGLLSALGTESAAARAKCIETLQHINVRLRAAPAVRMPFAAVLSAAVAPAASLMTRNVAVQGGYVARCFDRHLDKAAAFKPLVVAAEGLAPGPNRESLLALAIKALRERVRVTSALSNSDAAFRELLDEFSEPQLLLVLEYGQRAMRSRTKVAATPQELLALVRFCVEYAGLQAPERAVRVFPLLLVAAGTTSRDAVASAGEDGLKRIDACDVLLEHDPNLVQTLFDIFLDSAAEIPLRSLVLSKGLLRATLSASCFPEVLHVVDQAVYKPGIPDRLRSLGMQYVSFVVANGSPETLSLHGIELLHGMLKVVQDDTDGGPSFSPLVRGFGYTALAEILLRIPSLLAQHADFTPELFFTAAQSPTEPREVRMAASHALSTLAPVFSVDRLPFDEAHGGSAVAATQRAALLQTLRRTVENRQDTAASARAAAVLWANACFPFDDCEARLINIIGAGDDRPDVREAAVAGLSPKRFRSLMLLMDSPKDDKDADAAKTSDSAWTQSGATKPATTKGTSAGGDAMDVDAALSAAEADVATFPDFAKVVSVVSGRLAGSDGLPALELRLNSWAAFFTFAITTLRRRAQALDSELSLPGAWRGADADQVRAYLGGQEGCSSALVQLQTFANRFLLDDNISSNVKVDRAALYVVLFAAKIDRAPVAKTFAPHGEALLRLCIRKCATGGGALVDGISRLMGVASDAMDASDIEKLLVKLTKALEPDESGRPSGRHGEDERESSALCAGQIIVSAMNSGRELDSGIVSATVGVVARRFQAAVESAVNVRMAACNALGAIGVLHSLPLPCGSGESTGDGYLPNREIVVAGLAGLLKSDKSDSPLVEAACSALASICVGEPRQSFVSTTVEALLAVCKLRKEDEIRFTAGESLVRAAVKFDAPPPVSLRKEEDATESEEFGALLYSGSRVVSFKSVVEDGKSSSDVAKHSDLKSVLETVVELCYNERPNTRAGACVFLVTFLRLIGSPHAAQEKVVYEFETDADRKKFETAQEIVQSVLEDAQRAFTTLLSDRSDFVQQLASRGVALIYDMSTPDVQKELVGALVRSLTTNKRLAASTVAGDEGGLLDVNGMQLSRNQDGNTGEGGAGTGQSGSGSASGSDASGSGAATYKELCSLANDMGKPELVYKFLDLAGNTALWSNRRGAALAGSALLGTDLAAEQLRPHVKTLLPRLYVYCYDPTEGVRLAMASVLQSVSTACGYGTVSEAVTAHFDSVIDHCLSCMTARQWRVREAGSGAVRDLLPSRRWNEIGPHLQQLWYIILRGMDDIKESVRMAADGAGRAISTLSIRLCDANHSGVATASSAAGIVVPAVLPAFTHSVKEVRVLASTTLSKVIRAGGEALRPSVPDIMSSLLESATELEPQLLNYVQFHIDADQRDELEKARTDAASQSNSPVIEALERLAVLVDDTIAGDVVVRLVRLSRTGVGIPTRAATARFYGTLLSSRGVHMERYAGKLMHAATNASRVESTTAARRGWSNAVGLAARLSTVKEVGVLVATIVELSGAESAADRALASFLALGLWRHSPETARKHATEVLPVAYMGQHEGDADAKGAAANWAEVWSEGSPSSDAGLRLYSSEICGLCTQRLETSAQYKVKRSAATALGAMARALSARISPSASATASLSSAAHALLAALPGHIWEGKDAALEALGTIAESTSDNGTMSAVWEPSGGPSAVVTTLLGEAARGKREYRLAAMSSLRLVLAGCRDAGDFVPAVLAGLSTEWAAALDAPTDTSTAAAAIWETGSDASAVDARVRNRKAARAAAAAALSCLAAAYPTAACGDAQAARGAAAADALCDAATRGERDVRTAALDGLRAMLARAADAATWAPATVRAALVAADDRLSFVRDSAYALLAAVGKAPLACAAQESPDAWGKAVARRDADDETSVAARALRDDMRAA